MNQTIYLDNAASTPPSPEVIRAVEAAMERFFGNPSSSHSRGSAARDCVEEARGAVAELMGAEPESIIFTSGATEAVNLAFRSAGAGSDRNLKIVTSSVEHSCVNAAAELHQASGGSVYVLPVDKDGVIDLDDLERQFCDGRAFVSIQWVNNETGVIQPIRQIVNLARRYKTPIHIDAAQAYGKFPINVEELGVDYLSVSSHKIHGPQGVGALFARPGSPILPMMVGGMQENGRRGGTENVPGISGFGVAASQRIESLADVTKRVATMRDTFESSLQTRLSGISINGNSAPRVVGVTNICFHDVDGEALVARLDQRGIVCSQTSACLNHRPEPSYVLRAMGVSENDAYSSVRFSFSAQNTTDDVGIATNAVYDLVKELRSFTRRNRFTEIEGNQ